jgi:hypothetical protein
MHLPRPRTHRFCRGPGHEQRTLVSSRRNDECPVKRPRHVIMAYRYHCCHRNVTQMSNSEQQRNFPQNFMVTAPLNAIAAAFAAANPQDCWPLVTIVPSFVHVQLARTLSTRRADSSAGDRSGTALPVRVTLDIGIVRALLCWTDLRVSEINCLERLPTSAPYPPLVSLDGYGFGRLDCPC